MFLPFVRGGQESVRVILRCEAKETLADARPQARKNRRRIRWNTVRIFSGRERRRCQQIVCRSKRRLRSHMTGPETRLWSRLRARQLQGLKFRRQHGIGPYIVDFYCPEQSLVIEVDGDSHADADQIVRDQLRDKYFQSLGLRVIRYFNDDIVKNLAGVLEDLAEKLASGRPPLAPPYEGGVKKLTAEG